MGGPEEKHGVYFEKGAITSRIFETKLLISCKQLEFLVFILNFCCEI